MIKKLKFSLHKADTCNIKKFCDIKTVWQWAASCWTSRPFVFCLE